ncbi:DUF6241 domain-containing protein [Paraliobacillus sp. X-1268]|uniref:DUF6241 domain-containing protein n=1 Tax=Paraliobacillus sp. X-1268 TaxID=2213193 RepID=UPI000E3CA577|nr:DUF6241 domain-containing protein [Paraliobacillus sp. X-1268]
MKIFGWTISILIVLLIGVVGYFGFIVYQDFANEDDETVEEVADSEETQEVTELSEEKFENNEGSELNPFGDSVTQEQLDDEDYQEYIHQMSHQKVIADEKWGFYLITDERINWLIEGLDQVELGETESIYGAILKRWANADFSQVDQDHNTIWRLQGGTIGKATGVMSESEEEAFINNEQ